MWNFLTGLQTKLIVAGGVLLLILGLIARNRKLQEKADDLTRYKATKQRAAKADRSSGDVSDDTDWLLDRASRSGSRSRGAKSSFRSSRSKPSDGQQSSGITDW